MIKDKKLREGPGMMGKMHPMRPTKATISPKIINVTVKFDFLFELVNSKIILRLQQAENKINSKKEIPCWLPIRHHGHTGQNTQQISCRLTGVFIK